MTLRQLPPQVAIVCDDCRDTLGENEDGYTILLDPAAAGEIADFLDQYDWTTDGEHHRCRLCTEKIGTREAHSPSEASS